MTSRTLVLTQSTPFRPFLLSKIRNSQFDPGLALLLLQPDDTMEDAHETRAPRLLAATWSLTMASGVFLALRIYCKRRRSTGMWWDDHLMIAAWVSAIFGGLVCARLLPTTILRLVSSSKDTRQAPSPPRPTILSLARCG